MMMQNRVRASVQADRAAEVRRQFRTVGAVWADALAAVRKNRRALRLRGLRAEDLAFLELWLAMPRASKAALGRVRGYSRQAAAARGERLQALGAVVLVGGRLLPNVRGLLRWCAKGCADRLAVAAERLRAARAVASAAWKSLKSCGNSQNVNGGLSHSGTRVSEGAKLPPAVALSGDTRAVEAFWLVQMGLVPAESAQDAWE